MRATHRITWLLLSTCVLFLVTASDDALSNTSAPVTATTVGSEVKQSTSATATASSTPAVTSKNKQATSNPPSAVVSATDTVTTEKPALTQTPTATTSEILPASTSVTSPSPAAATDKTSSPSPSSVPTTAPADNNKSTQPTGVTNSTPVVQTSKDNLTLTPASPSGSVPSATNILNTSPSATTISSSSSSSSGGGGGGGGGGSPATSSSGTSIQAPNGPEPGRTVTSSTTQAGGVQGTGRIPIITQVSTTPPATGLQPTGIKPIDPKTRQPDGKGDVGKITATVTNQQPQTTQAPGNAGTTISPSTLTKTGATAGTGAGSTGEQITINTKTDTQLNTFLYSLNKGHEKNEKEELAEVCRRLLVNLEDGNCTLKWRHHNGKVQFDRVEINGKVKTNMAEQYYEEITEKKTDNKTLIAILASCGALLIMIVILAVCASHHRKPYHENQQHLTEELHTVENGYHDNPTLEVMEVQPEMQEKKMALNGEFNDSWIVPIDNLLKEETPDEEDTHL